MPRRVEVKPSSAEHRMAPAFRVRRENEEVSSRGQRASGCGKDRDGIGSVFDYVAHRNHVERIDRERGVFKRALNHVDAVPPRHRGGPGIRLDALDRPTEVTRGPEEGAVPASDVEDPPAGRTPDGLDNSHAFLPDRGEEPGRPPEEPFPRITCRPRLPARVEYTSPADRKSTR